MGIRAQLANLMIACVVLVMLVMIVVSPSRGQSQGQTQPQGKQEQTIQLKELDKVKIENLALALQNLQLQVEILNNKIFDLKTLGQDSIEELYKKYNLKKEDYNFDISSLSFRLIDKKGSVTSSPVPPKSIEEKKENDK